MFVKFLAELSMAMKPRVLNLFAINMPNKNLFLQEERYSLLKEIPNFFPDPESTTSLIYLNKYDTQTDMTHYIFQCMYRNTR